MFAVAVDSWHWHFEFEQLSVADMATFVHTGNLVSKSGLDLSQVSGFTVVAEKLNFFRYISHFR
jgi:hypothetical protein